MSLSVTCLAPFLQPPSLQLGYTLPSSGQTLARTLQLPLLVTKFSQPVEVPQQVFTLRWGQVAGPPFKLSAQVPRVRPLAPAALDTLLPGLNLQRLHGIDPDPSVAAAACVLHCGGAEARQVPCMLKIGGLDGRSTTVTVTVATADAVTTDALKSELATLLAHA